jgi:phosphate butyryltransferase
VLVGVREEIESAAREAGVALDGYRIVAVAAKADAAAAAVRLVASGEGDVLVKGLLQTSELLKPVLDKATGLGRGRLVSHVGVFIVPGFDRFVLVTDAALCARTSPKATSSCVETARGLGIAGPPPRSCAPSRPPT